MKITALVILFFAFANLRGQNPLRQWTDAIESRYDARDPLIRYQVSVDTTDLSAISVEIHLRNVPDSFRVAMVAHPEYDDKYYRYIRDFSATTPGGAGVIVRLDSALWQVKITGGSVVLRYVIRLPAPRPGQRAAWRPFLNGSGALLGGAHTYMYVLGHELASSLVQFRHPLTWQIATGLEPTVDPDVFFAPSAFILTDCPVLMGRLASWTFSENGVPHRIVYWPAPGARVFDTAALVRNIREIVHQTAELFGRLPYRDYSFLFQDNAYGALEHSNSVTIGIPSAVQAEHPSMFLGEIAHEYFHTWNIIRIHPAEYGDVSYRTPPYSRGLWWSEGLTMFYADLLVRRAGLPQTDTSRVMHLENLISRYYGNPGNHLIDPEKVSLAAYAPNGMLGDYEASTHLQGELLGSMMDLLIRDRTDGRNSMDDVMREMMVRFSGVRGFTGEDIDSVVTQICHCPMSGFFRDHIRGNKPIDFNTYLRLIGLRADSAWEPVLDSFGKPSPDLRIYPWLRPGERTIRAGITDPAGCWGKAGLHTGDIIEAVNGSQIRTTLDFWTVLSKIKTGDELTLTILSPPDTHQRKVLVTGYQQPKIRITRIADTSPKQQRLFDQWNLCK